MLTVNPENVCLVAHLVAKPGQEQALEDTISAVVPAVTKEPGCLAYWAHLSRKRPGTVVMYEVWEDQAALDAHAAGSNLKALGARLEGVLAEPFRLEPLRRIA